MLKKNIKLFIGIIIGAVVFGSIGAYAASKIYANNVTVDTTNMSALGASSDVNAALDYLYSQVGKCPAGWSCRNLQENPLTTTDLHVGDLIKMTPTLTSFTTDSNMTGFHQTQTINPQELQYWRVIGKNSDGTIDVVSEYVSSIAIGFGGVNGYKNFIGYLNVLASKYENSNYTVGSRYMGFDRRRATEYLTDVSKFDGSLYNAPWTEYRSTTIPTSNESYQTSGSGDNGYAADYALVKNAYNGTMYDTGSTDGSAKAYKVGTTSAESYWVASRHYLYSSSYLFRFTGKYVYTDGAIYAVSTGQGIRYFNGSWHDGSAYNALRPILTLKSNLNIVSGDGKSEETAYVLG